ncbi:MAG: hypothetical protein AAF915_03790 [Cyanobacteria bacterium P01_D01_bin.50]
MNPKSGCMLLQNHQPLEAIEPLEIAYSKMPRRDIANNLGIAYANDRNFHKAKYYLIKASNEDDIENISKYNLAIVKIQLEEQEDALEIAGELKQIIADQPLSDAIDAFEVASLYYLLNDCDRAYSCCKMRDWNIYNLFSWKYIPYLIYKNDLGVFKKLVNDRIEKDKKWIKENKDNDEYWQDDTEEEKRQELAQRESQMTQLMNLEAEFALNKPNIDINNQLLLESSGCLLFDCVRHGNPKDDE